MRSKKEHFDLRQIRAFIAVVRSGGFSKASQEIGLTQPTLSTHISNLERGLGVRLLDRAGRSVALTPAGMVLERYAVKILELCQESIQAIEAYNGQIRGEVHIESSTVPGEYILPRWLGMFHRRYPEVQVTLTVNDSIKVLDDVSSGEVPFGITGTPGNRSSLKSEILCEDEIILVAARDILQSAGGGKVAEGDITGIPIIRRESGSGTRIAVEKALRDHHIDPARLNWSITLGSTGAVIEGALAGLGAAFLSKSTVAKELREGQLLVVDLKGFRIRRGFYVVYHPGRTLSPAAERLREELLKAGQALLSGNGHG
jgi:DNA-binding transcriptional LysR family regulator